MAPRLDAAHSVLNRTGIPNGWMETTVADLARIVGGGTPDREQLAYWRNGTIPWITPTDLTANGFKFIAKGAESISQLGLQSSNATLVPRNSIVFSTRGTVGSMALAAVPLTCNQSCEILIPSDGVIDAEFLYYLLNYGLSAFVRLSGGTTFGAITRRDIARVKFAVPRDPNEQATIARILDAVDTALERTRAAVERARELRHALVQRVFSAGLRREPTRKTAIGHLPRSWEVAPVGSVVTAFQYGLSVPMQPRGALPILRMGNIQDGDVLLSDLKFVTLQPKFVDPYLLHRGDVLFNRTNSQEWVGKVGIFRHDARVVFASYLIRLLPDRTKVDNYYLGHVLAAYPSQCRIKRYATPGVQQVNINATNLSKVLIPLPPGEEGLREQRDIAATLEAADAAVRSLEPVLAAQLSLKKSLMHDLLTGRVRVWVASKVAAS
jgi:type I restriction enzyme, S subunit